jgi:hypothetical protein
MAGRNLWDLSCTTLDIVLSSNFGSDDLLSMFPRLDEEAARVQTHCPFTLGSEQAVYGLVHKISHTQNDVSRGLQERLNGLHAPTIEAVRRHSPPAVTEMCAAYFRDPARLPGLLWALLTDDREELGRYLPVLLQQVLLHSIRTWIERG